jgi:hypothetical protein
MSVIAPPRPIRAVVEIMCADCPFHTDGGIAANHPELPAIIESAERGNPFMCHETALKDARTRLTSAGDPDGIQPHMKLCRGARVRQLAAWRERVIASGHTPGPSPRYTVPSEEES